VYKTSMLMYSLSPVKVRSFGTSHMRQKSVLCLGFPSPCCHLRACKSIAERFEVIVMMNVKLQFLGCDVL
jgi:hypothetical protein